MGQLMLPQCTNHWEDGVELPAVQISGRLYVVVWIEHSQRGLRVKRSNLNKFDQVANFNCLNIKTFILCAKRLIKCLSSQQNTWIINGYMYKRLVNLPPNSFFLLGIRGAGKSTWIRSVLPDAIRIDLLDEVLFQDLLTNIGLFRNLIANAERGDWVIVDEVQRIPRLLNEVHRHIEDKGIRFALVGSSARKLKTAGTNLLAGRASVLSMFPLAPQEFGKDFHLDTVLQTGSIPLVWNNSHRQEALSAYTDLYLREEVRAEALVRNLGGFLRFLPVAAVMHGQEVNTSGIARDAAVSRSTVEGYMSILEDTLLTYRLHAFTPKLRVRERRGSKLYWVDPGLVRAVKRQFGSVAPEERGSLFEGWVFSVLRTHNTTARVFDDIGYWSPTNSQIEVDFLLRRDSTSLAIEVKSTKRYSTKLVRGLRSIGNLPGLKKRILVYDGELTFQTEDGINVWTVDKFLAAMANEGLWE